MFCEVCNTSKSSTILYINAKGTGEKCDDCGAVKYTIRSSGTTLTTVSGHVMFKNGKELRKQGRLE